MLLGREEYFVTAKKIFFAREKYVVTAKKIFFGHEKWVLLVPGICAKSNLCNVCEDAVHVLHNS